MCFKMKLAATAALAAMLAAGSASAAITVYTSQAEFLAALNTKGLDTFDDLKSVVVGVSTTRAAGAFSYTASTTVSSAEDSLLLRAGSKTDRTLITDLGADSILFTNFSSGVNAIGGNFFASGLNGLYMARPLGMFLYLTNAGDEDTYQYIPNATATSFLGFISTSAITELQVEMHSYPSAPVGYPTVNNLYLGTANVAAAVPEPGAWALMVMGFGAMGARLRSQRRSRVQAAA